MSQYPVNTTQGLYDAVNYLLAGPDGLGQNFAGFSAYIPAYVKGSYRQPFTIDTTATTIVPTWYVDNINVTNAFPVNVNTTTGETYQVQINFDPQSAPPFYVGDELIVGGIVDSPFTDNYNGTYGGGGNSGVLSCTTSSVVLQTNNPYSYGTYTSGGYIGKDISNTVVSTDCNARVTVTGATDRVFISAQLKLEDYKVFNPYGIHSFTLQISINRYKPDTNAPPTAPGVDFSFVFDATIAVRSISNGTNGTGEITLTGSEFIFTTVLDHPTVGYYWYILEMEFITTDPIKPISFPVSVRSLTAQVIKA